MEKRPFCPNILKSSIIIENAKKLGLFKMIIDLYPELAKTIRVPPKDENTKFPEPVSIPKPKE